MDTALPPSAAWQALALLAFSTAITPGPNNLMLLASGARFGLLRTLPHLLGVVFGTAMLVAANIAGFGALLLAWPLAVHALKVAGAGYLIYLAWRLTRRAPGTPAGDAPSAGRPLSALQALGFQFVNPKVWMMGLAAAVTLQATDARTALLGVALFSAVALPCILLWAAFGVVILRVLRTARARSMFDLAIAIALVATALMMLAG
ncbi:MAG: LysE family translocator [Sinimarinibacterium flocculans]|uniref:LysE family translocator n=1 Tax=Sinimarinibacterium flocculans TaxID=985250 RepID=UPI002E9C4F62|nr:LysE family translocator [Pseudomonadota bacterium]